VVATTDPGRLPERSTWYLVTNRPCPGGSVASGLPAADLAEVVRCYGLRVWVEQGYKQVKNELGWADFQVRSATAIGRHLTLVCCAFSYCWRDWFTHPPPDRGTPNQPPAVPYGERGTHQPVHIGQSSPEPVLAGRAAPHPELADPGHAAIAILARLVDRAPATRATGPTRRTRRRTSHPDLHPALTNHR